MQRQTEIMMTPEKLKAIISQGEGTEVELKESKDSLARKVYESICAFLNRRGGHVVLGVDNDRNVVGINPSKVQEQLDQLAKDMNTPQLFKPTYYLNFEPMDIDGKKVIYFYVPESTQGHSYKGVFYDRNQDGDFELRSTEQIANLFIRKSKLKTEDRVYPMLGMKDLDEEAFDELRRGIRIENSQHPWLNLSNEEIIRSAELLAVDPETGKEGLTLAAILLFGNSHAITTALPAYRIDLLCRVNNTELYDDRELLSCNLLKAYPIIMAFIKKHLPEQPYIEGIQRFSLRDTILREVVLNMIIHREYSSAYPTTFTIYRDTIVTENWNIPYVYGHIDLQTMRPHRKNPKIAKVFSQMGIVEELGSGMRKMFKYTPLYANGKEPVIEEQDVYRIEIPYIPTLQGSTFDTTQKSTQKSAQKSTQKILDLIRENPYVTTQEMADSIGIIRRTVAKHIKSLQEKGIIKRIGPDKGGYWKVIE